MRAGDDLAIRPLARGSDPTFRRLCDDGGRRRTFPARHVIFYQDDEASQFHVIVAGSVILYRVLDDGRRQIVEWLGQGDLLGLASDGRHDCTAEAVVEADLCAFSRNHLEARPEMRSYVRDYLERRVVRLHSHAVMLGAKSATERVSTFLLSILDETPSDDPGPKTVPDCDAHFILPLTRQETADYLGLTTETVSRVFSDLKRRGIISIEKHNNIRVTNVARLRSLSCFG
ncbi:Crp/Fnr family transcriptional regulator [Hartmannibacter diazotrophicus]|uniref:Crp/Fnr family transcriptional regulator n=1 Tax=Hartmannibacter diazotrophicus TaxID=1482074 RepID=UPI0013903F83|nr:Crp/Fnr family transcriptional regulator [Hartmannibacter diazotrophicus]